MKTIILTITLGLLTMLLSPAINAQGVAINEDGSAPDPAAILDMKSTEKGVLFPRMTSVERDAIVSPPGGMIIYQINEPRGLYYNTGSSINPIWNMVGYNSMEPTPWIKSISNIYYMAGNVGIKTTSPIAALHVGESALIDGLRIGKGNNSISTNSAYGSLSLSLITSGDNNTGVGYHTLRNATTGSRNTALGTGALQANITGNENTALGFGALHSATSQSNLVAIGDSVLYNNSTGNTNTAVGSKAMRLNTSGSENTAIGFEALKDNVDGTGNTAVGYRAGNLRSNITFGTFVGRSAWATADNLENVTGIGGQARPTASFSARIGNTALTSIGGYAAWTNFSDGRYKTNTREEVPGLDFIMKLRPVTNNLNVHQLASDLKEDYYIDADGKLVMEEPSPSMLRGRDKKSQMAYTGFIAQEVEAAAHSMGYAFSGVDKPDNESGFYGLRYAEFVVPLVKAMQEQQAIIDVLMERIETLENIISNSESSQ